jgi:hypothetical protein
MLFGGGEGLMGLKNSLLPVVMLYKSATQAVPHIEQ